MYDMAKRSLAFTVATGGLLLTGTGYAPADTAVGPATTPGQAQAQASGGANQASPSSVSNPVNVREMQAPASPRSGCSGGILSGNIVQAPVNVPLNACGNQAVVGGLGNFAGGSRCSAGGHGSGSSSGATAVGAVSGSRGILSGNVLQAPINVPVNLCGN